MPSLANLITDVPSITVGHAHDARLASGVTVLLFDPPATASVARCGGGIAGRDLDCLESEALVERIDAIVLSGGSGFGLDAATGAQSWLRERGRGLPVGSARVPIVPAAVLFDLGNSGDKDWGRHPPYRELAYAACEAAADTFALGSAGAGFGATTVDLKGGIGSASAATADGRTVAALAAVNAIGSAMAGSGPHFRAAPFERGAESGGLGPAPAGDADAPLAWKGQGRLATTLAVVATDVPLTKAELKRVALMAQGGLARALSVSHAPTDGDIVFAVSTGRGGGPAPLDAITEIGALASACLARAIARGVFLAEALPFPGALPSWRDRHGRR